MSAELVRTTKLRGAAGLLDLFAPATDRRLLDRYPAGLLLKGLIAGEFSLVDDALVPRVAGGSISQYIAIPNSSHAPVEVALSAATRKTTLQVATPSTQAIEVVTWAMSFDGILGTEAPGICDLVDVNVAATVTSLTPTTFGDPSEPASLCVGGTSATGYNGSAEGSITASRILDSQEVHPQTGYRFDFPLGDRPKVAVSRFLRVRGLFGAAVNTIPLLVWTE